MNYTANNIWKMTLSNIINCGHDTSPRGQFTKEILGNQTRVAMNRSVVTLKERNINRKFLFGEAWWILSGSNRVSDIAQYMHNIKQFSDNGLTFRGAYGPQVIEQLDYVLDSLHNDADSRQALLTIWRQNPRPSKDIPCTVAMQWVIRDNKLHCLTTMRSSDMYLGWVYDIFNFSCISMYILIALRQTSYPNLELGDLILTAGSQHIYGRNMEAVEKCLNSDQVREFDYTLFDPNQYDHPEQFINQLEWEADNVTK